MELEEFLEQKQPLTRREEVLIRSAWHWSAQEVRGGASRADELAVGPDGGGAPLPRTSASSDGLFYGLFYSWSELIKIVKAAFPAWWPSNPTDKPGGA
jgi:hypothetical protein